MAAEGGTGGHAAGMARTARTDRWWFEPLWTGLGFLLFTIYVNWEVLQGNHFFVGGHGFGGYLSPMYSPLLFVDSSVEGAAPVSHALFGEAPSWWPAFAPSASAFFILPFPLAARMTCYYYRKFYYRAYFLTPPACAVNPAAQPTGKYRGETMLFLFQNLHRYAIYAATVFIAILSYDAFMSYFRDGKLGIGVGSVILTINPILLGCWTFGCHAWRHLIGGRRDCFSCDKADHSKGTVGAYSRWRFVTRLNEHHMFWAWVSMIWVAWTAIYVRLVSTGALHDYNTWGS
jgi:hypothetical protein